MDEHHAFLRLREKVEELNYLVEEVREETLRSRETRRLWKEWHDAWKADWFPPPL